MGHLNPHRASAGEVFVQHSGKIVVGVLLGGAGGGVVGYLLGNGQMLWIATGAGAGAVGGFTVAYIGARALEDVRRVGARKNPAPPCGGTAGFFRASGEARASPRR